jgi:hypothetical protein
MSDNIVITTYWLVLALPVAIYLGSKVSRKFSNHAYAILGAVCIVVSLTFAAFVVWFFAQTTYLVFPGKRWIPATFVSWSESPIGFVVTLVFTLSITIICVWVGIFMLRLGSRPNNSSKRTRKKLRAA